MKKINVLEPKQPALVPRKRVAAYARVSMDTERLKHSLSAQISYYSALIQKNPEWSSADENIASVDQNGRVMGKQKGETIISAKSMDGTGIEASFAVKVIQPVREIIADNAELALPENTTWKQSIKTVPENVSNDKIIWTSSDEKIAAVDSEGTITANKIGKCVITGTAEDGGGAKVSVRVTVQAFDYVIASPGQVNVEFDTEEYSSIEIGVGSRGAYRRKTERYTEFGSKGVVIRAGDHLISPVKAGDDVVTVITRINGKTKKKEKYTVFVDQSAILQLFDQGDI